MFIVDLAHFSKHRASLSILYFAGELNKKWIYLECGPCQKLRVALVLYFLKWYFRRIDNFFMAINMKAFTDWLVSWKTLWKVTQETFNYLNSPKTFKVIETIMKNLLIDLVLVVPLAYCMEYFGKKSLVHGEFFREQ